MQTIKWIIGVYLAVQALTLANRYGCIWESRVNPTHDVEVTMEGGKQFVGDLSQAWNGDWLLKTTTGEIRFIEYQSMAFKPVPNTLVAPNASLWRSWRALVPMYVVLAIILALIGYNLREGKARHQP